MTFASRLAAVAFAALMCWSAGASAQQPPPPQYPPPQREPTPYTYGPEELVGADKVALCNLIPGSEDFAHFLEHKPGSFLRLGNGVESAILHSAKYDFADKSLTVGAAMWARLTECYLDD